MSIGKICTIRLGPLANAVTKKIKSSGETLSQYVRRLIASDLRCQVPTMRGFVDTIEKFNKERAASIKKARQDMKKSRKEKK